jgi:membrane protein YdbS with pleckstrin-like domain
MERAYRQLGYFALALVPVFIAGFWIPYLSEIPRFDRFITPAVHVHALLLFAWIGLLVIQPLAIRYRAYAVHRLLGRASYVLMALIVPFALAMVWKEYHEKLADGIAVSAALQAELITVAQLVVTAAMYVLAIVHISKREVPAHMRYMICIALFLMPAGLARTLGYWFSVTQQSSQTACLVVIELALVSLIIYDRSHRYDSRPYRVAFLTYNATAIVWLALGRPV